VGRTTGDSSHASAFRPSSRAQGKGEHVPIMQSTRNQTFTAGLLVKKGVNQTSLPLQDDERVEIQAVLYDQEAIQKLIDKLTASKSLLPKRHYLRRHTERKRPPTETGPLLYPVRLGCLSGNNSTWPHFTH
jgi:hypothetical protein